MLRLGLLCPPFPNMQTNTYVESISASLSSKSYKTQPALLAMQSVQYNNLIYRKNPKDP